MAIASIKLIDTICYSFLGTGSRDIGFGQAVNEDCSLLHRLITD